MVLLFLITENDDLPLDSLLTALATTSSLIPVITGFRSEKLIWIFNWFQMSYVTWRKECFPNCFFGEGWRTGHLSRLIDIPFFQHLRMITSFQVMWKTLNLDREGIDNLFAMKDEGRYHMFEICNIHFNKVLSISCRPASWPKQAVWNPSPTKSVASQTPKYFCWSWPPEFRFGQEDSYSQLDGDSLEPDEWTFMCLCVCVKFFKKILHKSRVGWW